MGIVLKFNDFNDVHKFLQYKFSFNLFYQISNIIDEPKASSH